MPSAYIKSTLLRSLAVGLVALGNAKAQVLVYDFSAAPSNLTTTAVYTDMVPKGYGVASVVNGVLRMGNANEYSTMSSALFAIGPSIGATQFTANFSLKIWNPAPA